MQRRCAFSSAEGVVLITVPAALPPCPAGEGSTEAHTEGGGGGSELGQLHAEVKELKQLLLAALGQASTGTAGPGPAAPAAAL